MTNIYTLAELSWYYLVLWPHIIGSFEFLIAMLWVVHAATTMTCPIGRVLIISSLSTMTVFTLRCLCNPVACFTTATWHYRKPSVHYSHNQRHGISSQITANSSVCSTFCLRRQSIGHWWIPSTKGQLRGKRFHAMTSSCNDGTDFSWKQRLHWQRASTISIPFINRERCYHWCIIT